MPKLSIPTKEIILPNYPDSRVKIYKTAPYSALAEMESGMTNVDAAKKFLPRVILEWNFTDGEGKDLDITYENISMLPAEDVSFLVKECISNSLPALKKRTSAE